MKTPPKNDVGYCRVDSVILTNEGGDIPTSLMRVRPDVTVSGRQTGAQWAEFLQVPTALLYRFSLSCGP